MKKNWFWAYTLFLPHLMRKLIETESGVSDTHLFRSIFLKNFPNFFFCS